MVLTQPHLNPDPAPPRPQMGPSNIIFNTVQHKLKIVLSSCPVICWPLTSKHQNCIMYCKQINNFNLFIIYEEFLVFYSLKIYMKRTMKQAKMVKNGLLYLFVFLFSFPPLYLPRPLHPSKLFSPFSYQSTMKIHMLTHLKK